MNNHVFTALTIFLLNFHPSFMIFHELQLFSKKLENFFANDMSPFAYYYYVVSVVLQLGV